MLFNPLYVWNEFGILPSSIQQTATPPDSQHMTVLVSRLQNNLLKKRCSRFLLCLAFSSLLSFNKLSNQRLYFNNSFFNCRFYYTELKKSGSILVNLISHWFTLLYVVLYEQLFTSLNGKVGWKCFEINSINCAQPCVCFSIVLKG